ncbi:MAG: hypothetical protein JNM63_00185 [Spirochaetia bacterium]|nr:hypothetical protein [Spirochaetia bacterium]
MSSVLFEQAVLSSLERELEKNHPISFKVRGQIYSVTRREDLVGYSLLHLVGSAVFHGLIPKSHAPLAHQIRFFRNLLMHQGLPHMEDQADCYRASYEVEMDNGFRETRSVEISHREVAEYCLGNGSEEIWAYYLLMRVRELMAEMFEEKG